jgi:lysophospholipase L1-like esterase
MVKVVRVLVLPLALLLSLLMAPVANSATTLLPNRMAALGDSITQAVDVCCSYGNHPANSWSTGYSPSDGVTSQYERIATLHPAITGHGYNDAVSGAKASGLSTQVSAAVTQKPDYVTLLIGANDLCTSSASTMTSTVNFTNQVRAALATLHTGLPKGATIFVSSIPNIYQLRSVLQGNWVARFVWATAGICPSMLASSNTETLRQQVVTREREFNLALSEACGQYAQCRWDGNSTYNYTFSASQISTLDYFHPSLSGQAALAQVTWKASWWGA